MLRICLLLFGHVEVINRPGRKNVTRLLGVPGRLGNAPGLGQERLYCWAVLRCDGEQQGRPMRTTSSCKLDTIAKHPNSAFDWPLSPSLT